MARILRMSRALAFSVLLAAVAPVMAQKEFTLEDLNYGGTNYRNMVPQNQYYTWWGDLLVRQEMEDCRLVDRKTGKERVLFTLKDINQWTGTNVHHLYNVSFPYATEPIASVRSGMQTMLVNFDTHQVVWKTTLEKSQASEWNAASKATAYVKDHQLYVKDAEGHVFQLTTDGSREIVYGQSVHRDEFGISGGLFWSPDGQRLAFYRMDQRMVKDYPQVDIFQRMATCEPDKYPMAGETSHQVTVGVYDLTTRKTVYLDAGDPTDRYFTNIAWSPDSKTIYMFELNRDQNDCYLTSYQAQTGAKLGNLYHETSDKYVEPLHPIRFLPWDSSQFVMQSQRDGYNHLYLLDTQGRQLRQLTRGAWVVDELVGFDTKHRSIIILSNEASPIQRNLVRVDVKTGRRTPLGSQTGWHEAQLSASGQYAVDRYSAPDVPRNIDWVETGKGQATRLFTAADPWQGYKVPTFECGTIKAADGQTDLYYRMVKPADFDAGKRYPTVVYVYGGPHAHNVDARWHYASRPWETYMAQQGYVVFILDNRGSERRGLAFEQATFRQLGQIEMQDQMQGVKFLQSLPYIDTSRLGVHGWSFGGFMTITLMTHYPDIFKVGVAGGPVIDWKYYEVMYGERYMDTPQANPEGYQKTSLLHKAKDLKGKLQVIIGYNDPTCVPQHSLSFLAECIKAGTQPDFFVYPGEPHNMRGHQSVHLHERITQYFEDYLK